jgi:hypothetical protein
LKEKPNSEDHVHELALEMFRLLASRGGSRNTEKQNAARRENAKKARWKKKHPGEPYQEEYR